MTALVILAAGDSTRLGFPKQTLLFKGKTLLEIAIDAGMKSKCHLVTVVLGANTEKLKPYIADSSITIIENPGWKEGIASSIRQAIQLIESNHSIDSAIFMLCDQPFVNRTLIDSLIYKQHETGSNIVACAYNNTVGVPALFHRSLFPELCLLNGNNGAKQVIMSHINDVAIIPFEKGQIDIDTIGDYEDLLRNS